jgi:hypothetical protein
MRNWKSLRMSCLNNRAQSLTELATFGSVLLVVLSFFIRLGLQYNYQQETNMRAFRMAMADAINTDTPDSSASFILVEDNHIPDPQDVSGVGELVAAQGSASVTWGNSLYKKDPYEVSGDLPTLTYVVNENTVEVTTAGYMNINPASAPVLYIKPYGQVFRQAIGWNQIRCYRPDPSNDDVGVMVRLAGNQTDIVAIVARSAKEPMFQIVGVIPKNGDHGDPITGLKLLASSEGMVNPEYFALNDDLYYDGDYDGTEDVRKAELQGLLPDTEVKIKRLDSLRLEETPGDSGHYRSTDHIATSMETTHHVRANKGGSVSFSEDFVIGAGGDTTWQTDK